MESIRRQYTEEFKTQAVELAKELKSWSRAGKQLGIGESVIRGWAKKQQVTEGLKSADSQSSVDELARLRRENSELKKVNQILKAAAAVFCQDQFK